MEKQTPLRFEASYQPEPNIGCWLWIGSLLNGGYGVFSFNNKTELAHRFSYIIHKGEILHGYDIDHTCHNNSGCRGGDTCIHRCCVNPAHLEMVTKSVNAIRAGFGGIFNKNKTHCPRKHELSGDNLYFDSNRKQRHCRICTRQQLKNSRARRKQLG